MAATNEDALGELYGFDSAIDEMYERGVDHADFDEDDALEAYEEIIQVGSAAAETRVADAVLSLAAQLLTKHFAKFPHVHLNVVDVLLALCAASRPQAVRIHSVRSLLQIVKSGHAPPLALACRERIGEVVVKLLQSEPSNVLVRHMTQLQEALVALNEDVKKQEKKEMWAEKREQAKLKKLAAKKEKQEKAALEKQEKEEKEKARAQEEAERKSKREAERRDERERRSSDDAAKRREETTTARDADRKREANGRDTNERPLQSQQTPDKRQGGKTNEDDRSRTRTDSGADAVAGRERARDAAKATNGNGNGSNGNNAPGCPPSAHIFVGGLPRDTAHREIINYLSCIDESIDFSCVQIKHPSNRNGAGYAFVSLESTDHARKAIRHIETTEFNGRKLIGDFARGPPCATLQFVKRNNERRVHEMDAFPVVDFKALDESIWDELVTKLKRYGPLEVLRVGCVRFRDVDSAKEVIRVPIIRVQGHSLLPVYDPEEQAQIDSSKRRPRSTSGADVQRERRGSDLSRYGGRPADRTADDRRGSRDFSRKSPSIDNRDRQRRRSLSIDRRESRDKAVLEEKPERRHSDSNQSRYGPREAATSVKVNARDARERSPNARRTSVNASPRRSRSRSPLNRSPGDRQNNGRERSRSPPRRRPSDEGRKPADDRSPRGEQAQVASRGTNSGRNTSPARGRQNSPPRRGSFENRRSRSPVPRREDRRSRSPVSRREKFERKYGRPAGENAPSPARGRSRSPRQKKSPPPANDISRRDDEARRDMPKRPRSRSQSPRRDANNRDEPPPQRRTSSDEQRSGMPRADEERQRNMKRERPRGRRENDAPKMSKYGTVKGVDRSPRSPAPPPARADRSRSRDSNRFTSGWTDELPQRRASSDSAPNANNISMRDRRASPPRHKIDDRNGRNERARSPPRSPRAPNNRDRPASRRSPPRGRSPPRTTGQKRERSRSPQRQKPSADGDRRSRATVPEDRGATRDQEQRQPNRANSPDRRRPKLEERTRDAEKRERETARDPPRKEGRESTRGDAHEKRKEERPKRDLPDVKRSSPPPSPRLRDQRQRSVSPEPSPRARKSNTAPGENDTKPKHESPRAAAHSSKPTTTSIYDIDECMVDYEEDDD